MLKRFSDWCHVLVDHFHTDVLNGTTYWDTGMAEIPDVDNFRVLDLVTNTTIYSPRDSQHAVLIEVPSSEFTLERFRLFSVVKRAILTLMLFFPSSM